MGQNLVSLDVIKVLLQNISNINQLAGEINKNSVIVTDSFKELEVYQQKLTNAIRSLEQEKSALMGQVDKVKLELDKLEGDKKGLDIAIVNEHERLIEIQRDKHDATNALRNAQLELDEIKAEIEKANANEESGENETNRTNETKEGQTT